MISNLEYYRLFIAAATLGSATRAADALHLTQSGVSQGIRKLEEDLGTDLFERSKKGLKLTAEGEVLFAHVKSAFKDLTIGERKVRDTVAKKHTIYSIGATETAIRYFLAEPLKQFHDEFPDVTLNLVGSTVPSLCEDLKTGRIEAAFLFSPIAEEDLYTLLPIAQIQDIPVAAVGSSFYARTLEELSGQTLISVSEGNSVRAFLNEYFTSNGLIFAPQITVQSMGQVPSLVKAGLGVGFIPDVMAREGLQGGSLIALPVEPLPDKRTLYFALLKEKPLLKINRTLLDLVNQSLGQETIL